MAGIYGVFLKDNQAVNFFELMSKNPIQEELAVSGGIVGRSTIKKLPEDRFFETRNGVTICFEGVNLNDSIINKDAFFEQYQLKGTSFLRDFINNIGGGGICLVYNELERKIAMLNDHLSTKNIFYFYHKTLGFMFSSELYSMTKFFRKEKINYTLNTDAVYMMALYGFLLEDTTYVNEIKKLPYSSVITYHIDLNELEIEKYHSYSNEVVKISHSDATDRINELMEASVKRCWNKDLQYGKKHLSLLSGGMDARTNTMIAKELGFDNIHTITFGESASQDVRYAKKIAQGEGFNHFTRYLDNPSYLVDDIIENYVKPVDGLMMFHTSAHTSSTIRNYDTSDYSLLHTGQIGDVLFGSFAKPNFDFKANKTKIGYTGNVFDSKMLEKITVLDGILEKYQELGAELYSYEQRQINATIVGDRSLGNVIDNVSPFYDLNLINFCLSLPVEYKQNQVIYYKWLKKYHPKVLEYPWEKIQMKPNTGFKMKYGALYKKYFNGAKKYFNLKYDSMNPYSQWIKKFPYILNMLNEIVDREMQSNKIDKELKEDLLSIYNKDIFEYRNKFAVVTALLAVNIHFGEED